MLTKITPQKVQDTELGYTVQVADRFNVEYIETQRSARIEVEFGASVGIYRDSLNEWIGGKVLTDEDKDMVLSRVEKALQFMGSKTEVC